MFEANPREPTKTTKRGFETSVYGTYLNIELGTTVWRHTRCIEEPFYGFEEDREAEGQEENAIDERSENLGSMPTVGITRVGMCLIRELQKVMYACLKQEEVAR